MRRDDAADSALMLLVVEAASSWIEASMCGLGDGVRVNMDSIKRPLPVNNEDDETCFKGSDSCLSWTGVETGSASVVGVETRLGQQEEGAVGA